MAKATKPNQEIVVKGEPTKDFFITMLIKDISLKDAIGDLVDNSVDAIKAKASNINDLKTFKIDIKIDDKVFAISDNGIGLEEETARKYAFKLGKPKNHPLLDHSIGRFGIGMKRAFFKIGNNIEVKSIAPTSRFEIEIPVEQWRQKEEDWDFTFKSVKSGEKNDVKVTGTTITIINLTDDSKQNFKKVQFENDLIDEIAREQMLNIQKGLKIRINGNLLSPEPLRLKFDDDIQPSFWKHTFKHSTPQKKNAELNVEVYAGVDLEEEDDGGWNVFCNDRLIMDRDTSEVTGWTGTGGDGVAKYHQQFWGFRGYVFFEASDSTLLPWNTTKTGLDPESTDYIAVRAKMIEMMKDVFLLLNRQKKEREKGNPEKNQILNNKVNSAVARPILEVIKEKGQLDSKFHFPSDFGAIKTKDLETIKFTVPIVRYNKVKKALKGVSASDVGSKTFDYYYENEIGD